AFVGVENHVVADGLRRPERGDAPQAKTLLCYDALQQGLRVREYLARLRAILLVLQDFWIQALELPRPEKRRPVDVFGNLRQRNMVPDLKPQLLRPRDVQRRPIRLERAPARRLERKHVALVARPRR